MPRGEHDCPGTRGKLVLTDSEHVLPLDHVEQLVLIRVYMEGSIERIYLFDDRERTGRGLRTRFDEEDRSRERQALSSGRPDVVAKGALISDRANLARRNHAVQLRVERCVRNSGEIECSTTGAQP